jgi:hypothetical protein
MCADVGQQAFNSLADAFVDAPPVFDVFLRLR